MYVYVGCPIMEYYDTSKDPRILFAEAVARNILDYFKSRKIQHIRRDALLEKLNNLCEIMRKIKWSYVSPKCMEYAEGEISEAKIGYFERRCDVICQGRKC